MAAEDFQLLSTGESARCPDPGCERTLEVDPESPNVLRCAFHGPMMEIREAYLTGGMDWEWFADGRVEVTHYPLGFHHGPGS